MITSGWLVCYNCDGEGDVPLGPHTDQRAECPECGGTGEPVPGTYTVDSEDDDFDHAPRGYDEHDFAEDK